MKQQDIVMIIVVAFVAGVLSLGLTSLVIGTGDKRQQSAQIIDKIESKFEAEPNKDVFNPQAVNPTKLIEIKDNSTPGDKPGTPN